MTEGVFNKSYPWVSKIWGWVKATCGKGPKESVFFQEYFLKSEGTHDPGTHNPRTQRLIDLREAFRRKKTIESVSMLIPRGEGGSASQCSHLLRFFSPCSKPTCLALGSHKTNFVLTPNSIFHMFSDLVIKINPFTCYLSYLGRPSFVLL